MQPDVIIIGAGAAGLMCAMEAGKRGRRVLLLDHASAPGEKIRISGGGRCNFTNLNASPKNYLSQNPGFCVSALARYTQHDFIALVKKHGIAYHEKTLGQLFCDGSAKQIIHMLVQECNGANVTLQLGAHIEQVEKTANGFTVTVNGIKQDCASLVVACGGLSIPKMGATGLGYGIAKQFGIPLIPTYAGLVPFTLSESQLAPFKSLSGVALDAIVTCNKTQFREGMLFTHRGLSGPSILQISSYWKPGQTVCINLAPDHEIEALLLGAKSTAPKQEVITLLSKYLPKRLAQAILAQQGGIARLADTQNKQLQIVASAINGWQLNPMGTEGYRTAEVTLGGVDTTALSSKTMESISIPGLYFIGEVVDVTGHLGGYNFQWAWSSGHAAGQFA